MRVSHTPSKVSGVPLSIINLIFSLLPCARCGLRPCTTARCARQRWHNETSQNDRLLLISTVVTPDDLWIWQKNLKAVVAYSGGARLHMIVLNGTCGRSLQSHPLVNCASEPLGFPKFWYRCRYFSIYLQYEAVWMVDGDVELLGAGLLHFLTEWRCWRPIVAQPTIVPETQNFWPMRHRAFADKEALRNVSVLRTDFVEQQAPILDVRLLRTFMPDVMCPLAEIQEQYGNDFSTDELWCAYARMVAKNTSAAAACVVIDHPMKHHNTRTVRVRDFSKRRAYFANATPIRDLVSARWPQWHNVNALRKYKIGAYQESAVAVLAWKNAFDWNSSRCPAGAPADHVRALRAWYGREGHLMREQRDKSHNSLGPSFDY